jgi:hypothetical protein
MEGITFADAILLSLIIRLCRFAKKNEVFLKTETVMKRLNRSKDAVEKIIASLKKRHPHLVEIHSKGYGFRKMRYIQVVDQRLLDIIGDVRKVKSVEDQRQEKIEYYERLNDLFSRDRLTLDEIRSVTKIDPARVVFYHVLVRCIREMHGFLIMMTPPILGYLKNRLDQGCIAHMRDIKRIVDAVANVKLEGKTDDLRRMSAVVQSYYETNENFVIEDFNYERLENELRTRRAA